MYVIRSGRLDVLVEGPPETLVRTLRRGDVVGELALLHAGRRTASVRARRDSVLLEVSRAQFEALVRQEPGFAVGLTRALGAQLAASRTPIASAPPPRTIAVVRLDAGAPGPDAVERLAAGLRSAGTLARLEDSEGTEAERLGAIERAEREAERVLLVAGPADEAWTGLCLREADLILALTSGVPDMGWRAHAPALQGCELLSAGGAPSPSVLASLQPREVQVISDPDRLGPALDSTARRLTGRAVGVVLSGGGARAFAHLGVLEELCAAGSGDRPRGGSQPRRGGGRGDSHGRGSRGGVPGLPGVVRERQSDRRLRGARLRAPARRPGAPHAGRELRGAADRGAARSLLLPQLRPRLPRGRGAPDRASSRGGVRLAGDPRSLPAERGSRRRRARGRRCARQPSRGRHGTLGRGTGDRERCDGASRVLPARGPPAPGPAGRPGPAHPDRHRDGAAPPR